MPFVAFVPGTIKRRNPFSASSARSAVAFVDWLPICRDRRRSDGWLGGAGRSLPGLPLVIRDERAVPDQLVHHLSSGRQEHTRSNFLSEQVAPRPLRKAWRLGEAFLHQLLQLAPRQ